MNLAEEIQGMLKKARRYLSSAELLRRNGDFDSAISRLYYAMFYGAEALLLAGGKIFSSHRAVVSAFGEHFVKPGIFPKEMHQWLCRAFEKRQISDYEFLTGISEIEVIDLQDKAGQFMERIESFLKVTEPGVPDQG